MNEFIECRKCKEREKLGISSSQKGYYFDTIVDEFNNSFKVLKECDCHKSWRENNLLEITLKQNNLSTDLTFNNYVGSKSLEDLNALRMISDTPDKYLFKQNYYLMGPNGSQKTSMAQVLGKELIKKGYKVVYVLMNEIVNNLVKEYNESEDVSYSKELYINKCKEADLLIVDEVFDKTKVTIFNSGYQIPYLDTFFRERYDISKKPTLFISNIKPEDIDEKYGISLKNFIIRSTQGAVLEFNDVYLDEVSKPDRLSLFKRG